MNTDLFQSCDHCWVFQICWHIECSTFTASSFRIWNSSTGIPSPPLALFVVMLSKAHLTSHSMSGSRSTVRHGKGNGNPLQDSCLETPMDRGAWGAIVHRVAKSQTRLSDFPFTVSRKWPGNRLGPAGQCISRQRAPLGGRGRGEGLWRWLESRDRLGSFLYLAP